MTLLTKLIERCNQSALSEVGLCITPYDKNQVLPSELKPPEGVTDQQMLAIHQQYGYTKGITSAEYRGGAFDQIQADLDAEAAALEE